MQVESKAKPEVDASAQPSYESLHHIAVAALWRYHQKLGRQDAYIRHVLGDFESPDPSKFPPDISFPFSKLPDNSLWFIIGHTTSQAPFYPVLKKEGERRLRGNPTLSKPSLESLLPPPDLFEQIAYNGQAK